MTSIALPQEDTAAVSDRAFTTDHGPLTTDSQDVFHPDGPPLDVAIQQAEKHLERGHLHEEPHAARDHPDFVRLRPRCQLESPDRRRPRRSEGRRAGSPARLRSQLVRQLRCHGRGVPDRSRQG